MRTIAITSGKGGVGKTNLSANLGIALALRGKRILLFDADLGLANLDVVLGCTAKGTLQNVLAGEMTLKDAISMGPSGVRFVAGGSGVEALVNLSGAQLERFLNEIQELEKSTDILIFDTGAGIDENVMTFLQAADEILLVSTPDPSSITDAYATAKTLWNRRPDARIRVVMNMVTDEAEGRAVFAKLQAIARQFLDKALGFAGYVRYDQRAIAHIRRRRPFLQGDEKLNASQDVLALSAELLGQTHERESAGFASRFRNLFTAGLKKSA